MAVDRQGEQYIVGTAEEKLARILRRKIKPARELLLLLLVNG